MRKIWLAYGTDMSVLCVGGRKPTVDKKGYVVAHSNSHATLLSKRECRELCIHPGEVKEMKLIIAKE